MKCAMCRHVLRVSTGAAVCAALLVAVTVLSACAPAADSPEVETQVVDVSADLAEIDALIEAVTQADMRGDIDGLLASYTDDVVSMPPDLPAIAGKEALRAYYEEAYSQLSIEALEMTAEETHVSGDWAFSRGQFTQTVLPNDGEPFDVAGKYLFIFHREADGSWKIARLIGNLNGPPPEM